MSVANSRLRYVFIIALLGIITFDGFTQICDDNSTGSEAFTAAFPVAGLTDGDVLCIESPHTLTVGFNYDYTSILNLTIVIKPGATLDVSGFLAGLRLGTGSQIIVQDGGTINGGLFGGITIGGAIVYSPALGDDDPLDGPASVTPGGSGPITELFSIQSGNWDNTNTWSGTSGGTTCFCTPTSDLNVTIEAHTIDITAASESADLTVENGGTLRWTTTGVDLTIRNSGDLTIDVGGAISNNSLVGNIILDNSNAGATSTYTNNGTVTIDDLIINSTTGPVSIINNATLTLSNLDANDADFTFDNSGTVNQTGIFDNMAGTEVIANLNGSNWYYEGATFDADTELSCNNGVNTFHYSLAGDQNIILPLDNYINLTTSGSGRKGINGNTDINGDLTLNGACRLDVRALSGNPQFDINLAGDWIINSTNADPFIERGRRVTFDGGLTQEIRGTTANPLVLRRVTFNTAGLTISHPVELERDAIFTNGIVSTDPINSFTFLDGSSSSSGNASSFIDGPVQKIGTVAFTYPVGDGAFFAPLTISSSGTSHTYTVEYFDADPGNVTTTDGNIQYASAIEYWTIQADNPGDDVNITLDWLDEVRSDIQDHTDLRVARWTGTLWEDEGSSTSSSTPPVGQVSSNSIAAADFGSPSMITFASANGNNALPIELLSFTGRQIDNLVKLNWSAATELNNDYYIIERSYDNKSFDEIKRINGAGYSTEITEYSTTDLPPLAGKIYYRLSQVDYDGSSESFDLVLVNYERNTTELELFPNPTNDGQFTLVIPDNVKGRALVRIFSTKGALLFEQEVLNAEGSISLNAEKITTKGLYLVTLHSHEGSYQARLILE